MVFSPPHVGRRMWQYLSTSYLQRRLTKTMLWTLQYLETMIWTCWPFSSLPQDLEFWFWSFGFGFWSSDFGSSSFDFGFWSFGFGFWSSDFGSSSFDFRFWSCDFGIWILGGRSFSEEHRSMIVWQMSLCWITCASPGLTILDPFKATSGQGWLEPVWGFRGLQWYACCFFVKYSVNTMG